MSEHGSVAFFVAGDPVPQPRPRARVIEAGGKSIATIYSGGSARLKLWRRQIADAWRTRDADRPGKPFVLRPCPHAEMPVKVALEFIRRRPSGLSRKRFPSRLRDTKKTGDVDNLAKAVLDVLSGKAYADDAQVCELLVSRWIARPDEPTGCLVTITILGEGFGR